MQTNSIFASAQRADTEQSGRSMIEMLAVLAIVGVLSVGGLAGYTVAMDRFKATKAQEELQTVVNATRTLYTNQNLYTGVTWEVVSQGGGIPDAMSNAAGDAGQHAFGGTIALAPAANAAGTADGGFTVTFNDVPADACISLVSMNWGNNDLVSIAGPSDNINTFPVDVATATGACNASGNIVWTFN